MAASEFSTPLGRSERYVKSCFSNFFTSHMACCLFYLFYRCVFDLYSLTWWSVIDVFAFGWKTESSNHSSITFDSSECIWPHSDKAWVYIQSDSVELFVHTWCFGTGLPGWALARWRISSPNPLSSSAFLTVVLWGWSCWWRVKGV